MLTLNQRITKGALLALLLVVSVLVGPSQLLGQALTGSLTGIVTDKSAAVIPNAKITMKNDLSGDTRRTQTNAEGYFTVASVLPGTYTVTIEAQGFGTAKFEKIVFTAGDRKSLGDVTLEVATTGTEVSISATVEELSTVDSGEKAVVLNEKQLTEVAVVGRSAAEFIKILPGMAMTRRNHKSTGLQRRKHRHQWQR